MDAREDRFAGTRYKTIGRVGRGASSRVYEVEDTLLGVRYIAKVLEADLARDPQAVDRMRLEAQAAARLGHTNIPKLIAFDVLPASGQPYIVTERLYGRTLRDELQERKRIPASEAIGYARQIASALQAAHSVGVVHRDLKPENLFLSEAPRSPRTVMVLDWGLAKVIDEAPRGAPEPLVFPTEEGVLIGSIPYMAPEQLDGGLINSRTDVYGLGSVLYEMLVGHSPFAQLGSTASIIKAKQVGLQVQLPRDAAVRHPRLVSDLLSEALAHEPSQRFASAAHMDAALAYVERMMRRRIIPGVTAATAVFSFLVFGMLTYHVWSQ